MMEKIEFQLSNKYTVLSGSVVSVYFGISLSYKIDISCFNIRKSRVVHIDQIDVVICCVVRTLKKCCHTCVRFSEDVLLLKSLNNIGYLCYLLLFLVPPGVQISLISLMVCLELKVP